MSVSASQDAPAGLRSAPRADPFNWPSLNRVDCMTLDKLDQTKDITHTKTIAHRHRERDTSNNLNSKDVEGKCYFFVVTTLS